MMGRHWDRVIFFSKKLQDVTLCSSWVGICWKQQEERELKQSPGGGQTLQISLVYHYHISLSF